MTFFRFLILPCALIVLATGLTAQGAQVAFGTIQENSDLPVEVTSDNLTVDQNTGIAIFTDNVVIVQGEMRLSADEVQVFYDTVSSGIDQIDAMGNVVLISGEDAAESERAEYFVADSTIEMYGNVLVSQGPSAVTGDRLTVRLDDGTALVSGRVRTILQPGGGQ